MTNTVATIIALLTVTIITNWYPVETPLTGIGQPMKRVSVGFPSKLYKLQFEQDGKTLEAVVASEIDFSVKPEVKVEELPAMLTRTNQVPVWDDYKGKWDFIYYGPGLTITNKDEHWLRRFPPYDVMTNNWHKVMSPRPDVVLP